MKMSEPRAGRLDEEGLCCDRGIELAETVAISASKWKHVEGGGLMHDEACSEFPESLEPAWMDLGTRRQ